VSDGQNLPSNVAILPKDTVVYLNGEPCRLVEDTPVVNARMAKIGFDEYYKRTKPTGWSEVSVIEQEPLR
jgi:hypothetical protein